MLRLKNKAFTTKSAIFRILKPLFVHIQFPDVGFSCSQKRRKRPWLWIEQQLRPTGSWFSELNFCSPSPSDKIMLIGLKDKRSSTEESVPFWRRHRTRLFFQIKSWNLDLFVVFLHEAHTIWVENCKSRPIRQDVPWNSNTDHHCQSLLPD